MKETTQIQRKEMKVLETKFSDLKTSISEGVTSQMSRMSNLEDSINMAIEEKFKSAKQTALPPRSVTCPIM